MIRLALNVIAVTILGVAAAVISAGAVHGMNAPSDKINAQTDGAFRDGLYLGALDARRGREHHIATGRWSNETDRRSFATGYMQGYHDEKVAQPR